MPEEEVLQLISSELGMVAGEVEEEMCETFQSGMGITEHRYNEQLAESFAILAQKSEQVTSLSD